MFPRTRSSGLPPAIAQPGNRKLELYDDAADSQWSHPPEFPYAAGGLVSTVDDYLAFGQMMLDNGPFGDERILSRASVELMATGRSRPSNVGTAVFPSGRPRLGFWRLRHDPA